MAHPKTLAALFTLPTLLGLGCSSEPAGLGWSTDFEAALAKSQETGRPVLADFTGSDWCSWCVRLRKEVFDTDAFRRWADRNVILVELDFPRKASQPADLKARNKELLDRYEVQSFPTVLLIDARGEVLGKLGYRAGGPTSWIAAAEAELGR